MVRHPDLSVETLEWGEGTSYTQVRAEHCPALATRRIAHVAVVDAAPPYTIVRTNLSGAFMQAGLGGRGQSWLDGRWFVHEPGMASFAPAHVSHAFHCVPGHRWQVVWVRFMPDSPRSADDAMSPLMTQFDGHALAQAVLGLWHESQCRGDAGTMDLWARMIERYISSVLDPWLKEPRLATLWGRVQERLDHDWSLAEMARVAGVSEEHLRRLCLKNLGRSPARQLTALRMGRAAQELTTTTATIESIAAGVGYVNPFAFSNTFKRLTGSRPSEYRLRPGAMRRHGLDPEPRADRGKVAAKR